MSKQVTSKYFQNKRNLSSTSSSDANASPENTLNRTKQERKKQRQESDIFEQSMASQTALDEIKDKLVNLATKDDIQQITEMMNRINDSLLKRIDLLENRVFDLESEKDKLHGVVKTLKEENSALHDQMERGRKDTAQLKTAINDQEQHGRGWNVRVHGVPEQKEGVETPEVCIDKCVEIFSKRIGVNVSRSDVEIAHRSGKPGGVRPRPIILRFFSRQKKGLVLSERRKLKNSGVSVSEDLTKTNYELLNKAYNHSATLAAWSSNGKVLVKLKNGKTLRVDIGCDLDNVLRNAMA